MVQINRTLSALAGILAVLTILGQDAVCQRTTASIVGTVVDSSGAAVPGTTIRITSLDTSQAFEAVTSSSGSYVLGNLQVGRYRVTATQTGFKTASVDEVTLTVGQTARIDLELEVGGVTETVEVHATAPLLNADDADLGQTIENKLITQLPLNGRSYNQLILLSPGTVQVRNAVFSGRPTVGVNGNRASAVSYRLDGVDNTDQSFETDGVSPSIDAIQEFKLQSMAFTAENGRGLNYVNVVLKSGTNSLHGGLFEFLRNDALDARNFFDGPTIAPLKRNQFGGLLGGPIVKNKHFFFGNYEGLRQRAGRTYSSTVATSAMRSGDFSRIRPIFDPQTYDAATGARDRFPNDLIPINRVDGAARSLIDAWYPEPNGPGSVRNFNVAPSSRATNDQFHLRSDHYLSSKDMVFVRYSFARQTGFNPAALVNQGGRFPNHRTQNGVVSWTHTFSANTINTFKFGGNRINHRELTQNADTDVIGAIGLLGLESRLDFPLPNGGVPGVNMSGYQSMGEPVFRPVRRPQQGWNYINDFSHIRGPHRITAGFDIRDYFTSAAQPTVSRGRYNFSGAYTNNPLSPAGTGDAFADLLQGIPVSATKQNPLQPYYNYWKNYAFYVQDEWKATQRLTVNLGARYELNPPSREARGQRSSFDPGLGAYVVAETDSPLPGASFPIYRGANPALLERLEGFILPAGGVPGYPTRSLRRTDRNNISPRIGIAYRPTVGGSMVIRAGYGIFYNVFNGNIQSEFVTVPFVTAENVNNTLPVPNFGFRDALASSNLPTPGGWSHQVDFREAYTHGWSLSLQNQIANNTLLEAAYIGNKGTRLEMRTPVNIPLPGPGSIQARRPLSYVSNLNRTESNGNSTYHSLQLKLERRYANGVSFLTSYTFAKTIDGGSTHSDFPFRNPLNYRLEKGLANHDVPHIFRLSGIYELPIGRGRRFGGSAPPVLDAIIGGWQINGILSLQSGSVFYPRISTDVANIGLRNRPNRVGGGELDNPTIDRWFDVGAFEIPELYTFGNTGRNILRGDTAETLDLGLFKNFQFREDHQLQVRAEFFNALNHPVFSNPNENIEARTAGVVSSASRGRTIQLALKYLF